MSKAIILHVEDEEGDVDLLQHAFREVGITNPVEVVRNGQQAIDYFSGTGAYANRKACSIPALVLLDLKLPVKSGLEVLEWMRAQRALRSVVVIVLSASCHPLDIQRAYELGANCFVTKPQRFDELVEMVHHFQAWWLHYTQFAPICETTTSMPVPQGRTR